MKLIYNLHPGFLAAFFTIACLFCTAVLSISSCEGAPMFKLQANGFYRTTVGNFEVIALADGTNQRSVEQQLLLLQGNKEKIKDLLLRAYPDEQIPSTVNAFLINTGSKLVLVDAGNGSMGSTTMGNVINHLRAAGYNSESIDEIYLTHMHADHIGGLIFGSERAFPNATVYVNKAEADQWLSESNMNAASGDGKRTYQAAKTAITPYINAGKFKTFEGNIQLTPGIRAQALVGHTPGHTAYFIESNGRTLVLWGDIVHVAAVQFEDPTVTIAFDSDKVEAEKTRQLILSEAATKGWLIGGAHLNGFGYVRTNEENGYSFWQTGE